MEYTPIEELEDKYLGTIGTPKRDAFEASVKEEIRAYHIGEAIKQARKEKNLTQEQLGNLAGIQTAQISKIENGKNLTLSTLSRIFEAMGIQADLVFGKMSFSLW